MRAVIDTNVLISGLLSARAAPGAIVQQIVAGRLTAVFDDRILAEYRGVVVRPRLRIAPEDARLVLDALEAEGLNISAPPLPITLPDADDLPFLEVAAWADVPLVTGNQRHFTPSRGKHTVEIVSAAEFVARLASPGDEPGAR